MFSIFKRKNKNIETIYHTIMDQSLSLTLYRDYSVPDTPQGRFQMIILHATPYFLSMTDKKETQGLFDMIFSEIELSFREIGVGDLAVPKKMKRYMQDFNGILQSHAVSNANHVMITKRNVFGVDDKMTKKFEKYITGLFNQ